MNLQFFRPYKGTNKVCFKLAPSEGGSHVSWIMNGNHAFMPEAMSLVMNMNKIIGTDFEKGLANLIIGAIAGR